MLTAILIIGAVFAIAAAPASFLIASAIAEKAKEPKEKDI